MPLYRVHMYPIGRITSEPLHATSPAAAAQQMDEATELIADRPLNCNYSDGLDGYQVDTLAEDGEVLDSVALRPDYSPDDGCPPGCYRLDARQHAMVLAALRYFQRFGDRYSRRLADWIHEVATDGGTLAPLTDEEIDELCEALNLAGGTHVRAHPNPE